MRRLAVLTATVVLAACGGEREALPVTEAEPAGTLAPTAPRLDAPLDTIYPDTGLFSDPSLDSLAADTLDADSLASGPDFRAFWPRFRETLATDPQAVEALAALGPDSVPLVALLRGGPHRDRALALTARDFRRDGTARDVWIRVGFDGEGNVVPEDEALTESGLRLRFEVVDGEYRLVRLDAAG